MNTANNNTKSFYFYTPCPVVTEGSVNGRQETKEEFEKRKEEQLKKASEYIDSSGNISIRRAAVAGVYDPKTSIMKFGVSVCCPRDVFSKRQGRSIAAIRAKTMENPLEMHMANDETLFKNFQKTAKELAKSRLVEFNNETNQRYSTTTKNEKNGVI